MSGLFSVWQNFEPTLAKIKFYWAISYRCKCPIIWKNNLAIWSHCYLPTYVAIIIITMYWKTVSRSRNYILSHYFAVKKAERVQFQTFKIFLEPFAPHKYYYYFNLGDTTSVQMRTSNVGKCKESVNEFFKQVPAEFLYLTKWYATKDH